MASKRSAPTNDEESSLVDDPAEDATSPKAAREVNYSAGFGVAYQMKYTHFFYRGCYDLED